MSVRERLSGCFPIAKGFFFDEQDKAAILYSALLQNTYACELRWFSLTCSSFL